jgi:predicted phage terminase large subunit-like protein
MMSSNEQCADVLQQQNFFLFLQTAFELLNPTVRLSGAEYLEAMSYQLQEAAEGPTQRLLVTIPPRHLKSISTSVALAAWMLGHDPTRKIIVASYGEGLARHHAADFRTLIESPVFRWLFPETRIDPRGNRADEIRTTKGGGRKAVSLGGAVTGFGADVIIIDDLMKAQDVPSERRREEVREYFEQTLYTRLDDKRTGRIIAIQQRLHEDDFAGYLIEQGSYTHLSLPAIAQTAQDLPLYLGRRYRRAPGDVLDPEREPMETLDRIRNTIHSYTFSAQYLQNPVPVDSSHLRIERMTLIERAPERDTMIWVVQSWDTAIKDGPNCDYSVCTTWGWKDRWYLLDVFRERLDFPSLKAAALKLKRDWRAGRVIVEDSGNGTALVQQLRRDDHSEFQYRPVKGTKFERFIAQTDILQSDQVVFPNGEPRFEALRHELFVFPNGRNDDQVDSITQFLAWAQKRGRAFVNRDPETGRPRGSRQRRTSRRRSHRPTTAELLSGCQ